MNLYNSDSGTLELPVGTYFVTATVQVTMGTSEGISEDQIAYIAVSLYGPDGVFSGVTGTGIVGEGETSGQFALTVTGGVTLTEPTDVYVDYSFDWQGEAVRPTSEFSVTQISALQLVCEQLNP